MNLQLHICNACIQEPFMLGGWLNISNNLKSLIKNLICQHRGGKDKIPTVSCIPVVHKNKPETIKYQKHYPLSDNNHAPIELWIMCTILLHGQQLTEPHKINQCCLPLTRSHFNFIKGLATFSSYCSVVRLSTLFTESRGVPIKFKSHWELLG